MKIAYIDLTGIAYDPLTPERLPLGGMQSAVCYLSREFTRQGHSVSLFNGSETDTVVEGIAVHGFARCFAASLAALAAAAPVLDPQLLAFPYHARVGASEVWSE